MNRRAAVVLAILVSPADVHAAFETVFHVMQPFSTDGGIVPCVTTYSAYFTPEAAPVEVIARTVAPNSILNQSGTPRSWNAAVGQGIRFTATQSGDTLFVEVDVNVADLPPRGKLGDWLWEHRTGVVAITLWCGLRNARQEWPRVRSVRYDVRGWPELDRFDGIYPLEHVPPPVVEAPWNPETFGP